MSFDMSDPQAFYHDALEKFLATNKDNTELDFIRNNLDFYEPFCEQIKNETDISDNERAKYLNYRNYFRDKEKTLTDKSSIIVQSNEENEPTIPYKIALLSELGFFELEKIKKISKENQYKVIQKLIGGTPRTIKGNVLVLNEKSKEDRSKYTSNNYNEDVINYLDRLK